MKMSTGPVSSDPYDPDHEALLVHNGHYQAPSLTRLQHAHAARAEKTPFCTRLEEKMADNTGTAICCVAIVGAILALAGFISLL